MKQADIVKVMSQELGAANVAELNKLLKAKKAPTTKFRITGKKLGHLGYTTLIKAITDDGLKIFAVNKVILLKFSDIETFAKAKPKVARPEKPKVAVEVKKTVAKKSTHKKPYDEDEDDSDDDDFDDELDEDFDDADEDGDEDEDEDLDEEDEREDLPELKNEKFRPKKPAGKSGSSFIPNPGKKKK